MRYALPLLLFAAAAHADILAVANRGGSTITLINPETMQSLGTVTVGIDPHEIAIAPDGRHAYVSNYGGQHGTTISVVDLQTRTKVKDIPLAPLGGAHGILAVNGKIWFTSELSRSVGRYDPATDRIDWIGHTNQEGSHMLAVRGDGSVAYTGNIGSNSASIIPVSGEESAAKVNVPVVAQPEGIALSPDGRELWLGSRVFQGISVIDTATEKVIATVAPGTFAYRLTFSPDGRHVLVPRPGEVAVFDAAQRTLVRTIATNGNPFSIVIAPDNRTAYVAFTTQVVKMDFTTGQMLGSVAVAPVGDGLALAVEPRQPQKKRRAVRS
jgi:YVTN family beta-propeller protein